MKPVDKLLWLNFQAAVAARASLVSIQKGKDAITYVVRSKEGNQWDLSLRATDAHVVGLDVVRYSHRSQDGQLFLTTWLFQLIAAAIMKLRMIQWIGDDQADLAISLGDGAMLVLDKEGSLGAAMALVYLINMWSEEMNRNYIGQMVDPSVEEQQPYPILPMQCRFVVVKGKIIHTEDISSRPNAVGQALVTCSRLLAASKGSHFLIHADVMKELDQKGGIDGAAKLGGLWDWEQSMHVSQMAEKSIKARQLCFYNVFGKYSPRGPMVAAGVSPAAGCARYNIGSHDVTTLVP